MLFLIIQMRPKTFEINLVYHKRANFCAKLGLYNPYSLKFITKIWVTLTTLRIFEIFSFQSAAKNLQDSIIDF